MSSAVSNESLHSRRPSIGGHFNIDLCDCLQTGPLDGAPTGNGEATASGRCWYGQANDTTTDLNFGNVCLGGGNGLTLGFWSNKNGAALIAQDTYKGLSNVNALNLANATALQVDFALNSSGYAAFRTWLLGATATNMAYMLSAQTAAMDLNITIGGANETGLLFAGSNPAGCSVPVNVNGYISALALLNDSSSEILANPVTLAGNPERICQEFKKNALDAGNNNRNWVQPQACPVVYPAP